MKEQEMLKLSSILLAAGLLMLFIVAYSAEPDTLSGFDKPSPMESNKRVVRGEVINIRQNENSASMTIQYQCRVDVVAMTDNLDIKRGQKVAVSGTLDDGPVLFAETIELE